MECLEEVFVCFVLVGFKLKLSKCLLFWKCVVYFGYIVFEEGIEIDFVKVKWVYEWLVFENVIEVKSFLGFVSYYWCFVLNFVLVVWFFYKLIEVNVDFIWIFEC